MYIDRALFAVGSGMLVVRVESNQAVVRFHEWLTFD